MKLYHGSPANLNILKPQQAKGLNKFENINGVFLVQNFLHAALYAIGKTLKGKTVFGVAENKLVIWGNLRPSAGYVYEVEVKNPIKGKDGQYIFKGEIKPTKKTRVFPRDFEQYIIRVKNKNAIINKLQKCK